MLQENKEEKALSTLLLQSFYSVTYYNSYVIIIPIIFD